MFIMAFSKTIKINWEERQRETIVRVSKTNKLITRPINKLYLDEQFSCEGIYVNNNKPRREAAVIRELKKKYSAYL